MLKKQKIVEEEEAVVETEDIEENEEPVKKAKREDYIVKNQDRIVSYLQNIVMRWDILMLLLILEKMEIVISL